MDRRLDLLTAILALAALWAFGIAPAHGQGSSAASGGLRAEVGGELASVRQGDQTLFEYRHAAVPYKPYVSQWFTPAGVQVLRDTAPDHIHHHAMMFALVVDGTDFWAEFPDKPQGRQVHRSLNSFAVRDGQRGARAGFSGELDWLAADGKLLLRERRTLEVEELKPAGPCVLNWQTVLSVPDGKSEATLTGTHYDGLGMRFVASMDEGGAVFNSENREGEIVRGDNHVLRARWSAYTAAAEGRPVTVALFDHPSNLRHPALMFYMQKPFAYLSVTLNQWKEPVVVVQSKPLTLRYGAILWDGRLSAPDVERYYQQWCMRGKLQGNALSGVR